METPEARPPTPEQARAALDQLAADETAVRRANREAMRAALADAVTPVGAETVRELVARREQVGNAFYTGD